MTFQVRETIEYQGQSREIYSLPLTGCETKVPDFEVISSGCWRGYQGSWQLRDDRLWLIRLSQPYEPEEANRLQEMFPGVAGPVEAVWFSGEITPDAWQVSEPFFVLVFFRGQLVLEQLIRNDGTIASSRLTEHSRGFVDSSEWDLVSAIHAEPNDAAGRLVYADWLEERDDPRSETIRQATELSRKHGFGPRNRGSGGMQSIPGQYVDPENRTWFWKRLAGIPEMTPDDAKHFDFLSQRRASPPWGP
jgi:uncharacterized protein (TIGR02996 family)